MKKNFLALAGTALVASSMFLTSCSKESDPSIPAPVISLLSPENGTKTATVGESVNIAGTVSAADGQKLTNFKISLSNGVTIFDTTFSTKPTAYTFSKIVSQAAPTTDKYTISATDDNSQTSTKDVTITYVAASAGFNEYTTQIFGAQANSTLGSFYATSSNTVYTQANAKSNAASVDFVYYYGATNNATVAAPSDADAGTIFNNANTGLQTWSVRNATKFAVTTSLDYATAVEADVVSAANAATSTFAKTLAVGSTFVFKTVAGKAGIAKVTALNASNSGSITVSVKVQK